MGEINRRDFVKSLGFILGGLVLGSGETEAGLPGGQNKSEQQPQLNPEKAKIPDLRENMTQQEGEEILLKESLEASHKHPEVAFVVYEDDSYAWIVPENENTNLIKFLTNSQQGIKRAEVYNNLSNYTKWKRKHKIVGEESPNLPTDFKRGVWFSDLPELYSTDERIFLGNSSFMNLLHLERKYPGAELKGKSCTPFGIIEFTLNSDKPPWSEYKALLDSLDESVQEIKELGDEELTSDVENVLKKKDLKWTSLNEDVLKTRIHILETAKQKFEEEEEEGESKQYWREKTNPELLDSVKRIYLNYQEKIDRLNESLDREVTNFDDSKREIAELAKNTAADNLETIKMRMEQLYEGVGVKISYNFRPEFIN